jgi:hypothetical protein
MPIHARFQFDDCGTAVETLSINVLGRIRDNFDRMDADDTSQFLKKCRRGIFVGQCYWKVTKILSYTFGMLQTHCRPKMVY